MARSRRVIIDAAVALLVERGFGATTVEVLAAPPVLTGIDGGRQTGASAGHGRRSHLRVVEAG